MKTNLDSTTTDPYPTTLDLSLTTTDPDLMTTDPNSMTTTMDPEVHSSFLGGRTRDLPEGTTGHG